MTISKRVVEFDGMRGYGVTWVLIIHAFPVQAFWMWNVVDMFFVLSGFLITDIIIRNAIQNPRFLFNYWMRRILRIWPVYYIALAASIVLWLPQWYSNSGGALNADWLKCFFFLQFTPAYFTGGHAVANTPEINEIVVWFRHSWSVAAEEQFYIFWPLLYVLLRGNRKILAAFVLVLLAVGITLRSEGYTMILLLTRIDGLVFGILLAMLRSLPAGENRWADVANSSAFYCCAILAGACLFVPYIVEGYSGKIQSYSDIATVGDWRYNVTGFVMFWFGFIGLLLNKQFLWLNRLTTLRIPVYLGTISYAIYMFQGPVRHFVERGLSHLPFELPFNYDLVVIPVAIGCGALSWHFMEAPFNKLKSRFPLR